AEHVPRRIFLEEPALPKRPEHSPLHGALETAPLLPCQATRLMRLHPTGRGRHDPSTASTWTW
ncbi:MAG TPA: hypothetical protein VLA09_05355, partial [Longimicrobiales bacterium]|nr:hypothetical protein [Longimicrobiales bacterium]